MTIKTRMVRMVFIPLWWLTLVLSISFCSLLDGSVSLVLSNNALIASPAGSQQQCKANLPGEMSVSRGDRTHMETDRHVCSLRVHVSSTHQPVRVCSGGTNIRLTLLVESLKPHSPLSYHHLFFILSRVPCSFSFNTARFTGTLQ